MTDELTPVRCGCGGEATVDCYLGGLDKNDLYYVYCPECNIQTANYLIEAEAVTAWNKAMSGNTKEKLKAFWDGMSAEMKEERKKGKWKPFDLTWGRSVYSCTVCGEAMDIPTEMSKPIYSFCPNCGADMRGDDE